MYAYAFNTIGRLNYDRTEKFWNVVLPRVKEQTKTLDRHCVIALYSIIEGASYMQLQDDEFWEIAEKKLLGSASDSKASRMQNKLVRYLNIDQICGLGKLNVYNVFNLLYSAIISKSRKRI